ncbi:MAG: hypothetical protein HQL38_10495 [Alphaproteobacteria bacterium]|nr:hypothetical protein [Alphaproteobacteria bacterium]
MTSTRKPCETASIPAAQEVRAELARLLPLARAHRLTQAALMIDLALTAVEVDEERRLWGKMKASRRGVKAGSRES